MKVCLEVIEGPYAGLRFDFDRHSTFIVGRSPKAQFQFPSDDIYFSRNHFLVEVNPPLCRLLDLNSTNGTFVNGVRVDQIDMKSGDEIRGGKTTIRVIIDEPPALLKHSSDEVEATQKTIVSLPEITAPVEIPKKRTLDEVPRSNAAQGSRKSRDQAPQGPAVTSKLPAKPESGKGVPETAFPQLPGFEILRTIGEGGMGRIYEAINTYSRRRVAIKVVKPAIEAGESEISRFIREAQILKSLDHPHIVHCIDLRQTGGKLCIEMDFIDGLDLKAVLAKRTAPLPVDVAVKLTLQLLNALAFAHQRGFVHRDVKPANLLLETRNDGKRHLLLADFGLARVYHASKLSGLTVTGDMGGTTPFMPPEQITNYRDVSPAADQYSAAATLYYMLTRQTIYDFPREQSARLLMILQDDPIPIENRRQDIPVLIRKILKKALSRSPEDRFPDVASMASELKKCI